MATADNVYAIHDEDGRILQSNQVFDNAKYADCLHDNAMKFIQHAGEYQNLHSHHVWNGRLSERPALRLQHGPTRTRVGAGMVVKGIPLGALVDITTQEGYSIFAGSAPSKNLDFPTPTPGIFNVLVRKWPFRDWQISVEVTA